MATGQAGDAPRVRDPQATPDGTAPEALLLPPEIRDRLNRLRDEVHHILHREFSTTAADLEQLRGILGDAAAKLAGAFCEMSVGSAALIQLLDGVPPGSGAAPLEEAAAIARDMSSKTGTTVQSLQFEDMATQLLQHVHRRLALLEMFSKEMAVLYPDPEGRMPPLTDRTLDDICHVLELNRMALSAVGHKAVQQQSMDSGVIELF